MEFGPQILPGYCQGARAFLILLPAGVPKNRSIKAWQPQFVLQGGEIPKVLIVSKEAETILQGSERERESRQKGRRKTGEWMTYI